MRSVPKLKVRTRLSLAFFLVLAVSWAFTLATLRYAFEQDRAQRRAERAADEAARTTVAGRPTGAPGGGIGAHPTGGPGGRPEDHGPPPGAPERRPHFFPRAFPRALPYQATAVFLLSLAAGAWFSRRITRPLAELEKGAHAFHERHFQHRIPEKGDDEFARVAASMNEMAQRVEIQISDLQADARRRQQLLADVAHELRSPVATLKTMSEALRDGVAEQPERRARALTTMVAMADRMQHLVTDLLELARLDLHELPLHMQKVDLGAVAAESAALHAEDADQSKITLHPVRTEGRPLVEGDPLRLTEILDNLIENAIDHAGAGCEVSVEVAVGEKVTVTVADTGRGISAQHLPNVFDPFYRADAARTPGDSHSGLGLRIARGLAEAHGGTLVIESQEGKGTKAILTIPSA